MALTTKEKNNISLGVFLGGMLLISGYLYTQYKLLVNSATKILKTTIHSMNLSLVDITVFVELYNKGALSVDVTAQDYNIYVNNTFVSNVKALEDVHIKAHGASVLPLRITFNPQNLISTSLANLTSIMNDKSKVIVKVVGKLTIKAGFVTLSDFPLELSMSLADILKPTTA